jgi:hypothetical protein
VRQRLLLVPLPQAQEITHSQIVVLIMFFYQKEVKV